MGGEDQGIDVLLADRQNGKITVLQAHYPTNIDKATPKAKWDALVAAIPAIQNPRHLIDAGREDIAELIEEAEVSPEDFELELGLVSLGCRSDQIVRACAQANMAQGFATNIKLFYDCQDDILDKYTVFRSK